MCAFTSSIFITTLKELARHKNELHATVKKNCIHKYTIRLKPVPSFFFLCVQMGHAIFQPRFFGFKAHCVLRGVVVYSICKDSLLSIVKGHHRTTEALCHLLLRLVSEKVLPEAGVLLGEISTCSVVQTLSPAIQPYNDDTRNRMNSQESFEVLFKGKLKCFPMQSDLCNQIKVFFGSYKGSLQSLMFFMLRNGFLRLN